MSIHCQSISPATWKRGTLQTLVSRAFKVCSNDQQIKNEIKHLKKKVFRDIKDYPNCTKEQPFEKDKNENEMVQPTQVTTNSKENEHLLILPYKGKVGGTKTKVFREHFKIFHTSK